MAKTHYPVDAAQVMQELSRVDPHLAGLIGRVGSFPTKRRKPMQPFESLLSAITRQQISGKAADTILARVKALADSSGRRFPTPEEILKFEESELRAAGLSRQKIAAVKDLAAKTVDGTVPPLSKLRRMPEEEILVRLTSVRGIGTWSVQMFLMFHLGRPDVMPIHDLGIQKGFQILYGHRDAPKPNFILEHAERWRPYRSIASWYLWRAVDGSVAAKLSEKESAKLSAKPVARRAKEPKPQSRVPAVRREKAKTRKSRKPKVKR